MKILAISDWHGKEMQWHTFFRMLLLPSQERVEAIRTAYIPLDNKAI